MIQLYHREPYLREHEAKVTKCYEKNGQYAVVLAETIFYPEGGGQSCDLGRIGDAQVLDVRTVKGEIVHTTDKPLAVGKTYRAQIDWKRRFSHMAHHTAEHLVSGVIKKVYGGDNVGFHLGAKYVIIDYNAALAGEDIDKIEELSNKAVFDNLPVDINYYNGPPEFPYRSKIDIDGLIRIVSIENWDVCACCGTQTKTTGEIGLIKISDFHKYKGGTRLYMLCGGAALADYQLKAKTIGAISALISAKPDEADKAVFHLFEEKNKLKQEINSLKLELNKIKADSIEPCEKIIMFLEEDSLDDLIRFNSLLTGKAPLSALFSGSEGNYKYCVYARDTDLKHLAKKINTALQGKGGGKEFICGSLSATKVEIENFFNQL